MTRVRSLVILFAALASAALFVVAGTASASDPAIGGGFPGPDDCHPGAAGGGAGRSLPPYGRSFNEFNGRPGLAPPGVGAAVDVDVRIVPGAEDDFDEMRLNRISISPTMKVQRDGSIDPEHTANVWGFRVEQLCRLTGERVQCSYRYHELPDGGVWELNRLWDGELVEHAFLIVCEGYDAFRAGPVDLGNRLVEAAKSTVTADQFRVLLAPSVRASLVPGIALPERGDATMLALMRAAASAAAQGAVPSSGDLAAIVRNDFSDGELDAALGIEDALDGEASVVGGTPCRDNPREVATFSIVTTTTVVAAATARADGERERLGVGAVAAYEDAADTLDALVESCAEQYLEALDELRQCELRLFVDCAEKAAFASLVQQASQRMIGAAGGAFVVPFYVTPGSEKSVGQVYAWLERPLPFGWHLFGGDLVA